MRANVTAPRDNLDRHGDNEGQVKTGKSSQEDNQSAYGSRHVPQTLRGLPLM